MSQQDPRELEREIGRALSALPTPRAPLTLLPRVMAAAERLAAGEAQEAVASHWSPLARAIVAAAAAAVVAAVFWMGAFAEPLAMLLPSTVQDAGQQAGQAVSTAGELLRVASLVWQAVVAPIVKGLFAITLILCAACALCAAALSRLALGGAHQS